MLTCYCSYRSQIDLKDYEKDKTHFIVLPLEDGAGSISLLVTITGIYSESDSNNTTAIKDNDSYYFDGIVNKYVNIKLRVMAHIEQFSHVSHRRVLVMVHITRD